MRPVYGFDELNALSALKARIRQHFGEDGRIKSRKDCDDIIDEMLDLYLLALAEAQEGINRQFGTGVKFTAREVQDTVYRRIDGATWADRVLAWYMAGGTVDDIMRIAETEAHRIVNDAAYQTAVAAGAKTKTWETMADFLVRDTHNYLHGTTVPIDAYFYSFMGGKTLFPGQWGIPEEDCNCRCWLTYK